MVNRKKAKATITSSKPDYRLKVLNKDTNEKGTLGAGWGREDGSIHIVLDPFCVVPRGKQFLFTLFPRDDNA